MNYFWFFEKEIEWVELERWYEECVNRCQEGALSLHALTSIDTVDKPMISWRGYVVKCVVFMDVFDIVQT